MINQPMPKTRISVSQYLALAAFFLGVMAALFLWLRTDETTVRVPVLMHDLPAYQPIQPQDLQEISYPLAKLPAGTVREQAHLLQRYPLTTLSQATPIRSEQLGPVIDSALISNTVVVGLPATAAMTLNGALRAGDRVNLFFPAPQNKQQAPRALSDLLVLAVQPAPSMSATAVASAELRYVIILALPMDEQERFAAYSAQEHIVLTRFIPP